MKKEQFAAVVLAAAMALASGSAMAAGDAKKGKKVFNKCKACHAIKAGKKKVGPTLFAIAGKKSGGMKGYKYSKALKASGVTWDDASLDKYLTKPKKFIPKGKMTFNGLKKKKDRDNVIAYLKTLK